MIELPKAFREEWIERLESGEIHQVTGTLVNLDREAQKTGCCCLGVAQCIAWEMDPDAFYRRIGNDIDMEVSLTRAKYHVGFDEMVDSDLPEALWDGSSDFPNELTYLNDGVSPQAKENIPKLKKKYRGLEDWDGEAKDFKFIAEFLKLNTVGV